MSLTTKQLLLEIVTSLSNWMRPQVFYLLFFSSSLLWTHLNERVAPHKPIFRVENEKLLTQLKKKNHFTGGQRFTDKVPVKIPY